jgi:expansin (peptidoglycan-binding protein)
MCNFDLSQPMTDHHTLKATLHQGSTQDWSTHQIRNHTYMQHRAKALCVNVFTGVQYVNCYTFKIYHVKTEIFHHRLTAQGSFLS